MVTHRATSVGRVTVGVGARRGATPEEVWEAVTRALREASADGPVAVAALATVDVRAGEPGLLAAARRLGVPLRAYPAGALAAVHVPHPSRVVREAVGTPSVAEAAALLASGEGARLLVTKRTAAAASGGGRGGPARVTVAVARPPGGPAAYGRVRR
ncbi:cobalamin biosynthesis protein [Streptomyces sp. DSM 42041]|uniref:Cobalamin biosynthesis protein n=1 Tax=Streptomyces hazeniae TaxID=3075538 RepID=A0ABU2NY92_9ACTN|nr:cobalamin biosynthesis protein [Streptomyces sp. DSM 42041]MDT0381670.1 cobalamin biosynthesis protein [Streptomyces sp. DSM 42041]